MRGSLQAGAQDGLAGSHTHSTPRVTNETCGGALAARIGELRLPRILSLANGFIDPVCLTMAYPSIKETCEQARHIASH
jgi:hypothetical protein